MAQRIVAMEAIQTRLLQSLKGTNLDLKTFIPLVVKYNLSSEFPSYYSHRYLHEKAMGRDNLSKLDAENRRNMKLYTDNIYVMEKLTRIQTNLALLRKHQAQNASAEKRTIDVELLGISIGDFVLATFPGNWLHRLGSTSRKLRLMNSLLSGATRTATSTMRQRRSNLEITWAGPRKTATAC